MNGNLADTSRCGPYIPIPLMAILFALGLWHEIVCSNRRIAADIKPTSIQNSTLYKIEHQPV
jgi:hypothetical protein